MLISNKPNIHFSFDRVEQPLNMNKGKFPFIIYCILHYVSCSFGLDYGIPHGTLIILLGFLFKTHVINGAILLRRIDVK